MIDIDPASFGGIGVFAIREMARFYRHVLIEKRFPHHAAVAFTHCGKKLFEALKGTVVLLAGSGLLSLVHKDVYVAAATLVALYESARSGKPVNM